MTMVSAGSVTGGVDTHLDVRVAAALDFGEVATGWIVERSGERSLAGHYLAKKCRVDASTANDTN